MVNNSPADHAERKLALDPHQSFIVQAPAGSGKTTLLVERYLSLLTEVDHPEEIVALTFTRKAAHEMRSRIIAALKQEQIKKWDIIQNPRRLRIQTIDAFCHYLVNQAPIFTKINPNHKIIQNQEAEISYRQAAQAVLGELANPHYSKHLETLLLHLANDWERAENLLVAMLKSREQWLPHLAGLKDLEKLRQKMELALEEVVQENIERCVALFPKELHHELMLILKTAQDSVDDPPLFFQKISYEASWIKNDLASWQGVATVLLTREYSWRKKITKDQGFPAPVARDHQTKKELLKSTKARMEALLETFNQHENLRASLENLLLSPPPNYSDQQWLIIESLLELLPLLAAHLKVIFAENRVTDHVEISMAALRALGSEDLPSDLALNLDYRIQHLLIDEFQDTSLSHYRLLEQLTATWQPNDGRTIFMVGDPMQSIYRFREAEVGLFLRVMRDGIGSLKPQPLTLTTNFRSTKNIIDWINNHFTKVLPALADISLGAVPFRPSTAVIQNTDSQIRVNLIKDGNDEEEAAQTISIIKTLSEQHPNDTIAVLVKARSHLQKIIPALQQANLPYQAFELETLEKHLVIRDLFSLTRALTDLADRIAWIAILRAPWCGLTLADIHKVTNGPAALIWDNLVNCLNFNYRHGEPRFSRRGHPESFKNTGSPREAKSASLAMTAGVVTLNLKLSPDGEQRLGRLKLVLEQILMLKERTTPRELVERAWLMLGGPATVSNPVELEYAAAYFELLETPLDISLLQKKLASLYPPPMVTAKIQLMTIHKAKGLEFDHVIIPGINRTTRSDEHKLLLWFERPKLHRGSSLLLAPIFSGGDRTEPIYQYLRTVEQKKGFYETGRLLYVALTRVKKSAHIIGTITDASSSAIQNGSLLEQLRPCFEEGWVQNSTQQESESSQDHLARKPNSPPPLSRLCSTWQMPITIELPPSHHQPAFESVDNQAASIGTVIHSCLHKLSESLISEPMAENTRDNWLKNYLTTQQPYWRKLLQQAGYLDLEHGLKLIDETLSTMLQDQWGRWILTNHQQAANELAVTTATGDKFIHYVIDRTFIDEEGTRWIIDYKTSKPNHENIQDFLDEETAKYANQMLAYKNAMQALEPTSTIRLGLYFPRFGGWIEIIE